MTFILRLPSIVVLFALALLSLLGAAAVGAALAHIGEGVLPDIQARAADAGAAEHTWLDVGLWAAAGIFFFVSAVRLIRRTQGFWAWILAFACYGGRWAWAQQQSGSLVETIKSVDINVYRQPQQLLNDFTTTEAQLAVLAIILVVGLFIFIIDAADRAYWDRQGG